ncbi:hypothetical protein ADL21_09235 [Streptomyces albus subsp. albus]|nr:hypothetical protein ADL21_09235 [Streptomyces albus subsp. albus]
MTGPISTVESARTFARSEELCRKAREAIARAYRIQGKAVEQRLYTVQLRASLSRRRLQLREGDGAGGPDRPCARPLAPTVQLTLLTAFVHARLDEEAAAADLFHEAGCPATDAAGRTGVARCDCRVPSRIRQDIAVRRSIARASETAIREADPRDPSWPQCEMSALLYLKCLALPYELHGLWQEEWRP